MTESQNHSIPGAWNLYGGRVKVIILPGSEWHDAKFVLGHHDFSGYMACRSRYVWPRSWKNFEVKLKVDEVKPKSTQSIQYICINISHQNDSGSLKNNSTPQLLIDTSLTCNLGLLNSSKLWLRTLVRPKTHALPISALLASPVDTFRKGAYCVVLFVSPVFCEWSMTSKTARGKHYRV